jgi:hypothetical protein
MAHRTKKKPRSKTSSRRPLEDGAKQTPLFHVLPYMTEQIYMIIRLPNRHNRIDGNAKHSLCCEWTRNDQAWCT